MLTLDQAHTKLAELNLALAPISSQLCELVQKFNRETEGYGVEVCFYFEWKKLLSYNEAFGRWELACVDFDAKLVELPSHGY